MKNLNFWVAAIVCIIFILLCVFGVIPEARTTPTEFGAIDPATLVIIVQ